MDFAGKKTERFWLPAQVRVDGSTAAEIRLSHQQDGRGRIQDQVSFLLMMGLEYRRLLIRNGQWQPLAHASAQNGTSDFRHEESANTERHEPAQRGTSEHKFPPTRAVPSTRARKSA